MPAYIITAIFGICIVTVVWLSVFLHAVRELDDEVARIQAENSSLARTFEEHIRRILKSTDNSLLFIKKEFEKNGRVTESVVDYVDRAKQDEAISQIAVLDNEANLLLSAVQIERPVKIGHHEAFERLAADARAELYIEKPTISKASGTSYFFLARRLNKPNGSFGGIVLAGLNTQYFSDYFSSPELGANRAVILVGRDGIVRARRFQKQFEAGQDLSKSPLFEHLQRAALGHYEVTGIIDGQPRFASYRALSDYPLIVVVSDLKATALAPFEKRKREYISSALLFSLFVAGFCLLLIRAERNIRSQNKLLAEELHERKKAEDALQKSLNSLQAVVDSIDAIVYVADMNSHEILLVNNYTRRLFGEIQGRKCWETIQKGQTGPCSFCSNSRLTGADGQPLDTYVWEFQNTANNRWYACHDKAIKWIDGRVVRLEIATDITDQKKMEDELLKTRKLESVGVLAAGIAHDFNNLLQVIMGNISLAKSFLADDSSENIAVCLEHAEEASSTAKELSFRLLTFSKGGEPMKTIASLEKILKRSADVSLSGSNINCDIALPPDLSPVYIDQGQITQVFSNIIMNAGEAMPHGGTVTIRAANVAITDIDAIPLQQGNYVKISIQDNGIGISKEILPMIFDPYFTTKDVGPERGTGLGLAISLSIVRKHAGHITVRSEEGAGTTVEVYLPAGAGMRELPEPAAEREKHPPIKRLLWMDDDKGIRALAKNLTDRLGYQTVFSSSGEEAVSRYRQARESGEPFDAVILDLTVQGGMGGEETIQELRKSDPNVTAVISSGYIDDPIMRDFRKYGFAGALTKPYTTKELIEVLHSI